MDIISNICDWKFPLDNPSYVQNLQPPVSVTHGLFKKCKEVLDFYIVADCLHPKGFGSYTDKNTIKHIHILCTGNL